MIVSIPGVESRVDSFVIIVAVIGVACFALGFLWLRRGLTGPKSAPDRTWNVHYFGSPFILVGGVLMGLSIWMPWGGLVGLAAGYAFILQYVYRHRTPQAAGPDVVEPPA